MTRPVILGIDIGGSGIKGAPVHTEKGILLAKRCYIPTPQPSTPEAVAKVVAQIVTHFDWQGPIGCTFPAVVIEGAIHNAANVDKRWIGVNGETFLSQAIGYPVRMINDADAAGIAEMEFGAGHPYQGEGVVFVLTFGTGIGSAIFVAGRLLPNAELGHMEMHGMDAEQYASARVRTEENLSWEVWAGRVEEFLQRLELLFSPDLFVIGGGISRNSELFLPLIHTRAPAVPAQLYNEAGIIGAAWAARYIQVNKGN